MKKTITILIFILCAALSFSACQATPEVAPVVNRREDVRAEAIKETPAPTPEESDQTQPPKQEENYGPTEYKVLQHWTENTQKGDYFSVSADIDVQVPDVEKLPVEKLRKDTITQQQVDDMIAKLLPGEHTFYQYPMPNTKEYYEERIVDLKQSLAKVEAGGDGEHPDSLRKYIEQAEAAYATAPEENELVPATTEFDYSRDYETGLPDESSGKHEISVATKTENGQAFISAINNPEYYSGMSFTSCVYMDEKENDRQIDFLMRDKGRVEVFAKENFGYEEEFVRIDKEMRRFEEYKSQLDKVDIDMTAMQTKAIDFIKDMGIDNVQITSCIKAVYNDSTNPLDEGYDYEKTKLDKPGCYIEFSRQNGGVACVGPNTGGSDDFNDSGSTYYAAPFFMENGFILFDSEGSIKEFSWSDPAVKYEEVAADVELLDFDEIKDRAVDRLFYKNPYLDDESGRVHYNFTEAKLFMGYVNTKDDPESALIVPIWRFGVDGKYIYKNHPVWGAAELPMPSHENIYINALDGGVIVLSLPGTYQ